MQRLSAWLLAALGAASVTGSASPGNYNTGCYYSDGTHATDWDFRPCGHTNTTFNTCCLPSDNDLCLANGLCEYPGNYIYRGPCDNVRGDGCRSICPDVLPNSWVQVQSCTTTEFCCSPGLNGGTAGDCCNDGSKRFELPVPKPTTSSSSASSARTTFSSASSAPASSSTTSAPTSTPSSDSSSSSTPTGAIAGGVVGGVVGLGVVGAVAWLLLRRRRRHGGAQQAELPGYSAVETKDKPYGAAPLVEMPGHAAPVESDSRPLERFEMAG